MMNIDFLIKDKDITNLSNFKTKAFSKYYFEINNLKDLEKINPIYLFSKENDLKLLFVWAWTNMLFAFDTFDWIVIKNNLFWWTYDTNSKILESFSNEKISDISLKLERDYWQELWHRFIWLPGSIWWAVFGNAWCFWLETENNFLEATIIDLENGQKKVLSKKEMNFSYRNSILKETEKYFLVSTKFDLSTKIEKYSSDVDNLFFRQYKQAKWYTCWSFFKNPSKENPAWKLIEEVWLKWYKLWWAFFSEKHANFLVSDWSATYKDLLDLINLAKKEVRQKFWIDLVNEVRIIEN